MTVLGIIGIFVVGLIIYRAVGKNSTPVSPETSPIAGTVNFNGLSPADAKDPSSGKISLMQQVQGTSAWVDTGTLIPFEDSAPWTWTGAQAGSTYNLKADVSVKGTFIKSSNIVTATSPAAGIVLTFNIGQKDLPANLVPSPSIVTVSGTITINGHIPSGSTVTIFGRQSGTEAKYQPAVEKIPAKNGATWSYAQAQAGISYDYQAELYTSSGDFIGQSAYLTVTAPAQNEIVTINSTATPPSQAASLTGTVTLRGPVTQGSTILVLQRKSGASDYTTINRYPASASVPWTWDGAVAGSAYDITAALQVNEQNTATGNVETVTAPAEAVSITINTGVNLPPPTQTVSVSCGSADGTNHFNAQIGLPQQSGAELYYLEVGTSAGANNTFAATVKPNQTATVFVAANSPNFARYTYSACADCNIKDTGNWAGWSPTYGFTCPATATP
jgi:hypothetical protein